MRYSWVVDAKGRRVQGVSEAESEEELRSALTKRGQIVSLQPLPTDEHETTALEEWAQSVFTQMRADLPAGTRVVVSETAQEVSVSYRSGSSDLIAVLQAPPGAFRMLANAAMLAALDAGLPREIECTI